MITRKGQIQKLHKELKRLEELAAECHTDGSRANVYLQTVHGIVNVHEAIERLRCGMEKHEGTAINVTPEQVAQIVNAIKET